jgi:hypothetical protein
VRLIELGSKSGKWADIAADPLGWVVVFQDEATGDLVLCQLHPDGSRRVSDYREPMGRDNGFPRVHVFGRHTYIAWRYPSEDKTDAEGKPLGEGVLWNVTTGTRTQLGLCHGDEPFCFGGWFLAYQSTADYRIDLRVLAAPEAVTHYGQMGRPTGLSTVDDAGRVTLVDDVRTSVDGMTNPRWSFGRQVVVGEADQQGQPCNLSRLTDGRECVLFKGQLSFTPRIASRDGVLAGVVTWGHPHGIRLALLEDADYTVPVAPVDPFELAPDGTLVEDCFPWVFGSQPSLSPVSTPDAGTVCIHKNVEQYEWWGFSKDYITHLFDASRFPGDPGWYIVPDKATVWMLRAFKSGTGFTCIGERVEHATGERVDWRHTNRMFALKHGGVMLQFDPRFPGDYGMSKRYERFYWSPAKFRWEEWYTPAAGQPDVLHRRIEADVVPQPTQPYVECPRPVDTEPTEPSGEDMTPISEQTYLAIPQDLRLGALARFRDEACWPRDRVSYQAHDDAGNGLTNPDGTPIMVHDQISGGAAALYFWPAYLGTIGAMVQNGQAPNANGWTDASVRGFEAACHSYWAGQGNPHDPNWGTPPPPTATGINWPVSVSGRDFQESA